MSEPIVSVKTEATVQVSVDSLAVRVSDGPLRTVLTVTEATPDAAFARLARFSSQLAEAIADAADQYGIE